MDILIIFVILAVLMTGGLLAAAMIYTQINERRLVYSRKMCHCTVCESLHDPVVIKDIKLDKGFKNEHHHE
jgi:flagellar biosynthesis protein FliQ